MCVGMYGHANIHLTGIILMQELLNNAEKSLSGFSSKDGAGILFMLSQLLKEVTTRAEDVANWPNVSSI